MRTDLAPFNNKYVRQAMALVLDRPDARQDRLQGLCGHRERQPLCPGLPRRPSVRRRSRSGPRTSSWQNNCSPRAACPEASRRPSTQSNAKRCPMSPSSSSSGPSEIGVDITLVIEPPNKYYGNTFGSSDWLDGQMSMVDYGARSTPNLFLEAPLQTRNAKTGAGEWNAARFNNATYDKLSKQYVAAVDLIQPTEDREADRAASARRDADHLPVLLQLYERLSKECLGNLSDSPEPVVPLEHATRARQTTKSAAAIWPPPSCCSRRPRQVTRRRFEDPGLEPGGLPRAIRGASAKEP